MCCFLRLSWQITKELRVSHLLSARLGLQTISPLWLRVGGFSAELSRTAQRALHTGFGSVFDQSLQLPWEKVT